MSMKTIIETQEMQRINDLVDHGAIDLNGCPMPLWCITIQMDISRVTIRKWMRVHGMPYEGCLRCVYRPEEGCTKSLCDQAWRSMMERA